MVGVAPFEGCAGGLRVAQPLLLLLGIEDDARRRLVLPEDQAVDEGLVLLGDGAGVAIDLAADVGIDATGARLGDQRLLRGFARARRPPAPASSGCTRPARTGDSASLAWSAGEVSCGRGSPGRGGRSSALGGMVSGECETILNSSGETFLPPPRFSKALQPPKREGADGREGQGKKIVRRIICPWNFCPSIMA